VAGHGRDDQQRTSALGAYLAEIFELPKRFAKDNIFVDRDRFAADLRLDDPEFRLATWRGGVANTSRLAETSGPIEL